MSIIGVSLNIGSHAWYKRQVLAERRVAAESGFDLEVRDAADDPERQVDQIRELVRLGARAIVVSATNPEMINDALDDCFAAGIPVVGESIALTHKAVVAEVRVDDVAAGIDLGRAVGTAIQSRSTTSSSIQRVTLVGFPRLREAHDRERGFLEGVRATVPDILALYLDGRAQVSYARRAVRTANDALSPTDRIAPDVLFGVDDESVIGARQGYADLGTDLVNTITATYGISPPSGPRYLDDGTITYGAAMFPEWHGEVLLRLALAALSGQPHEQLVHPPAAVVAASGSPLGWDRFYHVVDQEFELDREAILAIGGSLG